MCFTFETKFELVDDSYQHEIIKPQQNHRSLHPGPLGLL